MFENFRKRVADAGYSGIREEHIQTVAKAIRSSGVTHVDTRIFRRICYNCGINPNNFTNADLEKLQKVLDEEE